MAAASPTTMARDGCGRDFLHHDLGEGGLSLLRDIKRAVDPKGIMNPGNLIPEAQA